MTKLITQVGYWIDILLGITHNWVIDQTVANGLYGGLYSILYVQFLQNVPYMDLNGVFGNV